MSPAQNALSTETCGQPTEVYSRVVGYFRPLQNWNAGKQEEFKNRAVFKIAKENTDER
jgi:ribonucleoside-triphosphate reductase